MSKLKRFNENCTNGNVFMKLVRTSYLCLRCHCRSSSGRVDEGDGDRLVNSVFVQVTAGQHLQRLFTSKDQRSQLWGFKQ